ncbi:MAG: hypothetical protein Q8908_08365 [Bacteroidota bacterium]|nr:hypothetical protein [Bacteroidota bacterium]
MNLNTKSNVSPLFAGGDDLKAAEEYWDIRFLHPIKAGIRVIFISFLVIAVRI